MISAVDPRLGGAFHNCNPTQGSSVFGIVHLLVCSLNLDVLPPRRRYHGRRAGRYKSQELNFASSV